MWPLTKIGGIPPEWEELYLQMEENLLNVTKEIGDTIGWIRRCLEVCHATVNALKARIHDYSFHSDEEEIYFFKEVKPAFYSHLIYYLRLFDLESARPVGRNPVVDAYLSKALDEVTHFFSLHVRLYQYYRSGSTYLDRNYFMRGPQDLYLQLGDDYFSYDASFSTTHDVQVARLFANEKLLSYISQSLQEVKAGDNKVIALHEDKKPLRWTSSKAALIELLYALQTAGVFNTGNADVKGLARYFEQAFDIQLGNYYNVFQEMRIRKKNRTQFLDLLKEKLLQRMDEADENMR